MRAETARPARRPTLFTQAQAQVEVEVERRQRANTQRRLRHLGRERNGHGQRGRRGETVDADGTALAGGSSPSDCRSRRDMAASSMSPGIGISNVMDAVHAAARQGFTNEAQAYARGRPGYPPALAGWLTGALALGPGRVVADVGAGTGKFTRLLTATGADVIAVEPVDAMRACIEAELPAVKALAGTAQSVPLPVASLDAIVCAQAFHWFASSGTLDEFHRLLKPGAHLGLVWNVRDELVDWVAALTAIVTPYEGDAPRFSRVRHQRS